MSSEVAVIRQSSGTSEAAPLLSEYPASLIWFRSIRVLAMAVGRNGVCSTYQGMQTKIGNSDKDKERNKIEQVV
jgi:hypothetical protein